MGNMNSLPDLAVTGSTGHLGGLVARELAGLGIQQRLLARTPANVPELPGASALQSSYANDKATRAALAGVHTLFMVSGAESADRLDQHRAFVDAAAAAGVSHIVYTSFYGAAADSTFTLARDHWVTEQYIIASGMRYTFLRDCFYIDFLPSLVGDDGVIRGPAGDGRVAAVTRADIAHVATTVLRDPSEHSDVKYELTGPQALSMTDVARILTQVTGRTTSYQDETIEEAYESRRRWDAPAWQYDAWVSTYTAIAAGELAGVTDTVQMITGREPQSLTSYLRTHQV